jgi:hypothetical protein
MAERLRYVFEDANQPAFRDDVPVPRAGLDPDAHRRQWGAFWREQWSQPFPLDAMALRLVVEGVPGEEPDVTVELDFDPDWTAIHELVRRAGTWVASGDVGYRPRREGIGGEPTARAKRRANLDRHRARIDALLRNGIALDVRLQGSMWELLSYDWKITAPRSRRGRRGKVDADEVDRLLSQGHTVEDVAAMYGVHPKTPSNALHRARKREI